MFYAPIQYTSIGPNLILSNLLQRPIKKVLVGEVVDQVDAGGKCLAGLLGPGDGDGVGAGCNQLAQGSYIYWPSNKSIDLTGLG